MMPLAPALAARNPNGHTPEEVLSALRGERGSRRWSFRYALLDSANRYVRDLDSVVAGTVSQSWLADIKRTAAFTMRETGGIDFLSDRIQPWVRLHLPPYGDRDWVEWPQGVFLLTTPERKSSAAGVLTREVEGFDQLQVYADDIYADRLYLSAGLPVTGVVRDIIQSVPVPPAVRTSPSPSTLPAAKEWEPGTSKLRVINDLLGMINYESLSFDEDGAAVIRPYRSPQERAEEYVYADDQASLVVPELTQRLDLWSIPNRWVLVVSEPDQPPLVAAYVNANPASPTSTVRRGRVITDFRTEQEAVDQFTLQQKAARLAFEASQVYESIPFSTGLMPLHSGNDVYRLRLARLAVDAKYAETSWKMPLKAGARMEHEARRVITV
jgi:hypothetical protein